MKTASWSTYAGPGRVAISPPPPDARRGYRVYRGGLFAHRPMTPAGIRAHLAHLDPKAEWVALHAASYPAEPCIMGDADPGASSYRVEVARWLSWHVGEFVSELEPKTHRPCRIHPYRIHGLSSLL